MKHAWILALLLLGCGAVVSGSDAATSGAFLSRKLLVSR